MSKQEEVVKNDFTSAYFYFRYSSPTVLESVSHVSSFMFKLFTNCPLSSCSFLAADILRELVALTFDLLTLVSGHTWRVTYSIRPPSLKVLWISVLTFLSSDISYRIPLRMPLQTLRMPYHVTYAQTANFSHICKIADPDLPIH